MIWKEFCKSSFPAADLSRRFMEHFDAVHQKMQDLAYTMQTKTEERSKRRRKTSSANAMEPSDPRRLTIRSPRIVLKRATVPALMLVIQTRRAYVIR